MLLAAGARLGPYEIIRLLGEGGMGEVYRGRDPRLGRDVAIKVMPRDALGDPRRLLRFEQEARLASSLNHPGIVSVFGVGQTDAHAYIVMELIEGKSLRDVLVSGPLPLRKTLEIAAQVADALAKAHDAGIVHRDFKPENVMVTSDGYAKVLDFGLARPTDKPFIGSGDTEDAETATALTSKGVVLGTVGYMSPEQASGLVVDYRTDQFSLGAVLYEALTGKRAFKKPTAAETLAAIINEEPDAIGSLNPKVPPPVGWIVERCLAKNREDRYRSTVDLGRDLRTVRDRLSEVSSGGVGAVQPRRRLHRRELLPWVLLVAASVGFAAFEVHKIRGPGGPPAFRPLAFRRGVVSDARFAPDGKTIVASATWEGAAEGEVFEGHTDRPGWRSLGVSGYEHVAVSARGELALMRIRAHGRGLVRLPMAGGAERPVREDVDEADWAPDGDTLAGVTSLRSTPRPGTLYTETSKLLEYPLGQELARAGSGRGFGEPRVSRDGRYVAVLEGGNDGNSETVAVIDRLGKRKDISTAWASTTGLAWAPKDQGLWVTGSPSGQPHGLYSVSLDGAIHPIARIPGELRLLDVADDGRALVARVEQQTDVRALAPEGPREVVLSWSDSIRPVALSTDGTRVLFRDRGLGGGSPASYLGPTDGSPPMRVSDSPALALSPDAKKILTHAGPGRLQLVPSGPGVVQAIEYPGLDVEPLSPAALLADGRILVSARMGAQELSVWVVDDKGSAPRSLTVGNLRGVSPDGRWAFGFSSAIPVDDGEPRTLPLKRGDLPLAWSPDGQFLFVAADALPRRWPIAIERVTIATGERKSWRTIPSPDSESGAWRQVLLTPDGKSYVYSFRREQSRLYLLEGVR